MNASGLNCTVVDVGARYGIHPSWKEMADLVTLHLVEMEDEEARRLAKMYAQQPNIKVHDIALYKTETTLRYRMRRHKGLVSLYSNNDTFREQNRYFWEESAYGEERETEAQTIDNYFSSTDIHFLKLDTEGSELDILRGGEKKLQSSVLGVRAEVNFAEIYSGIPLFGEIHTFLLDHDFMLLNLDYDGRGHSINGYTRPERYGYLVATEAVWIRRLDTIFAQNETTFSDNVVRMALFLLHNNGTDVGVDLLLRAVKEKNVDFSGYTFDPLFVHLKRKVALLFKGLLSLPQMDPDQVYSAFSEIFGEPFPTGENFYETFRL